jgi:hypothetical protein
LRAFAARAPKWPCTFGSRPFGFVPDPMGPRLPLHRGIGQVFHSTNGADCMAAKKGKRKGAKKTARKSAKKGARKKARR